jgi:preprotein translocase subunit SecY
MTSQLWRRIVFTLGALLVYRLGTYIPLPGIDAALLRELFRGRPPQLMDFFSLVPGNGMRRVAIFSLDLVPYLSAAIIVQLASMASRRLWAFKKEGARGRAIIERWTRYLTVLLGVLQGFGVAFAYESIPGLVADPGWLFVITTALTLSAGTMFLVWLSTQITLCGVGNGLALLLLAGFVTEIPRAIAATLELGRQGVLSQNHELALAVIVVAAVALVVLMEQGRRRISVRYARREIGVVTLAERSAPLTLKLNKCRRDAGHLRFLADSGAAVGRQAGRGVAT